MREAAGPSVQAAATAATRGESVLDAWLGAMKSQAYGAIAREAFEWVEAERGRKIILEWKDDGLVVRRLLPDGSEA